jgi:hypothetical protein
MHALYAGIVCNVVTVAYYAAPISSAVQVRRCVCGTLPARACLRRAAPRACRTVQVRRCVCGTLPARACLRRACRLHAHAPAATAGGQDTHEREHLPPHVHRQPGQRRALGRLRRRELRLATCLLRLLNMRLSLGCRRGHHKRITPRTYTQCVPAAVHTAAFMRVLSCTNACPAHAGGV